MNGVVDYANRIRLPVEIVRRIRERVGPEFIIIFRLSMLDMVEAGSTLDEIITLGHGERRRTWSISIGYTKPDSDHCHQRCHAPHLPGLRPRSGSP
ncbi:MAG: hypothetical protein R3E89_13315 [Thiolinea sp.]